MMKDLYVCDFGSSQEQNNYSFKISIQSSQNKLKLQLFILYITSFLDQYLINGFAL